MALRNLALIVIAASVVVCSADDTYVPGRDAVEGKDVGAGGYSVARIRNLPYVTPSDQSSQPEAKSDQTFSGTAPLGVVGASTNPEKQLPSVTVNPEVLTNSAGRKLARKMLQTESVNPTTTSALGKVGLTPEHLKLDGDGTTVGSSAAGVKNQAYGEGLTDGGQGTHITEHGVKNEVSTGGESVRNVGAGVNPDGIGKEGSIVTVGGYDGR